MGCPCATEHKAGALGLVTELVHRHRAHLVRVARSEGLGAEDALDVVQEAFQGFLGMPADEPEGARRLLVALTRNLARNRRRLHALARPHDGDAAALEALPAGGKTVEELVVEAQDRVRLAGCVASLADVQRIVITLRMLDDVPGEDVARTLGLRPGHVAVLLHRAKANLAACMSG